MIKNPCPNPIFCNSCGKDCRISLPFNDDEEKQYYNFYGTKINIVGGYLSTYLNDLFKYSFALCEECLGSMFDKFQIKPRIVDVDINGFEQSGVISWKEDREIWRRTKWANNKEAKLQKKLQGLCNETEDCQNKAICGIRFRDEDEPCGYYNSDDTYCEEHSAKIASVLGAELYLL